MYKVSLASAGINLDAIRDDPNVDAETRHSIRAVQETIGVFALVPGGQCTFASTCTNPRGCVGCAMKAPDPAKAEEIIREEARLTGQYEHAVQAGWIEARRLKAQLDDARRELVIVDFIKFVREVEDEFSHQERQLCESFEALRKGVAEEDT